MTEDRGEIKFRYSLKQGEGGEAVRIFPVSRWVIYLILAPFFVILAFLSAFFFSIFFPLFLFGGLSFGLWFWRLRRKLLKSNPAQSLEGEYVVINEIHIVETKTDKMEST
ncbi:conserved hypothetical protein [Crenothrix polyspora]|uniref:Uncharacterized protein n=1 Tax=Crenothrix polyspora TaxID=360316 RepID=A0A1R4H3D3_9GAMM|nr:hypothetical protein [Crenothrix polyspora]SJM90734.1 conserved hypothetical protein [Crenothrix polyspora]